MKKPKNSSLLSLVIDRYGEWISILVLQCLSLAYNFQRFGWKLSPLSAYEGSLKRWDANPPGPSEIHSLDFES